MMNPITFKTNRLSSGLVICLIFSAILFGGCAKSLVYSPSLNLTASPLAEKAIDFQGGVELMPETRPEGLGGNALTLGMHGQIGYGFGSRFNLAAKAWVDLQGRESAIRSGYALQSQFLIPFNPESRLILIPRAGMAMHGGSVEGYGVATSAVYQTGLSSSLSAYAGLGFLWGFRYLEKDLNAEMENKIPMGYGLLSHIGLGWNIAPGFRLNVECNPVYQINSFEGNEQFLLSPSIGLGYTILPKQEPDTTK